VHIREKKRDSLSPAPALMLRQHNPFPHSSHQLVREERGGGRERYFPCIDSLLFDLVFSLLLVKRGEKWKIQKFKNSKIEDCVCEIVLGESGRLDSGCDEWTENVVVERG
jgi:hypothetical protein